MPRNKEQYREVWLGKAMTLLRKEFEAVGALLSPKIQVSCSWPHTSIRKRIGECWYPEASADGVYQIFVSPRIGRKDTEQVLEILIHELCHTLERGHKAPFQRVCKIIGLEPNPKWTGTRACKALSGRLKMIAKSLGPYPHGQMTLQGQKKQTTRLLKLECEHCGCVIRVTRKWLDEYAGVTWPCPCEGKMMEIVQ